MMNSISKSDTVGIADSGNFKDLAATAKTTKTRRSPADASTLDRAWALVCSSEMAGLSQRKLAAKAGVSHPTICNMRRVLADIGGPEAARPFSWSEANDAAPGQRSRAREYHRERYENDPAYREYRREYWKTVRKPKVEALVVEIWSKYRTLSTDEFRDFYRKLFNSGDWIARDAIHWTEYRLGHYLEDLGDLDPDAFTPGSIQPPPAQQALIDATSSASSTSTTTAITH